MTNSLGKKHIETKLSAASSAIYKLRKYIPQKALMSVYYSLGYSYLQYAIICWGNSSKVIKHKLQVKQNRIIKTLFNKFGTKTTLKPLYKQLQVLNIDEIYKLEVAKFMAKVNLNKLPVFCSNQSTIFRTLFSFHTYSTRSVSSKSFYVQRTSLVKSNQSLKISGVEIWNSLPRHISIGGQYHGTKVPRYRYHGTFLVPVPSVFCYFLAVPVL